MYVCVSVCLCVSVSARLCACASVRLCVCVSVCLYASVGMCVCACVHACAKSVQFTSERTKTNLCKKKNIPTLAEWPGSWGGPHHSGVYCIQSIYLECTTYMFMYASIYYAGLLIEYSSAFQIYRLNIVVHSRYASLAYYKQQNLYIMMNPKP